jgi:hypothetical protein
MRVYAAALLAIAGCADEGTLDVRIYGESFIEDGIPAGVFVDGWTMQFSRYVVAIDHVSAEGSEDDGHYVFDLHTPTMGEGREVASLDVPSGAQRLGFRIGPGETAIDGMDVGLFVEGVATKDATNVAFAFAFDSDTAYHDCEVVERVPAGGSATTTITIHADHIFYDDLESTMPNTSFDLIAASDADMDGKVTKEELLARDITTEARYQVGSNEIYNLWDYMTALSKTVGHIDGEGECKN